MRNNNYYVIGGQYEQLCYGGAPTLIEAKRLANRNAEYFDNWQGWHTPKIYAAADTQVIAARGCITHSSVDNIRVHIPVA